MKSYSLYIKIRDLSIPIIYRRKLYKIKIDPSKPSKSASYWPARDLS